VGLTLARRDCSAGLFFLHKPINQGDNMYNLYRNEYDAKNCIFGGLHDYKFTVRIDFGYNQISVFPVINVNYMAGPDPKDEVRAIQPMDAYTVCAYTMWSSNCTFKDTTDGQLHRVGYNQEVVICAIKSIDELPRVWNDALRLMNRTGIFVFRHRSINGKLSLSENWALQFYSVPYTGLVTEQVDEGLSRTTYQLDATDENYFYRTVGELTAHYKRLFTPAVLDELVALFKNGFNKAEQERRDQIYSRMNKLLALQEAEKPLPPPPTVNEWWNGLTEVEKENIRARSVPKPKTAKKTTKKK
jgi:hypothetical protein